MASTICACSEVEEGHLDSSEDAEERLDEDEDEECIFELDGISYSNSLQESLPASFVNDAHESIPWHGRSATRKFPRVFLAVKNVVKACCDRS